MGNAVELKVVKSLVKAGGVARVNGKLKERFGLENGGMAVVSSGEKDILVNLFLDEMVDEENIKLREEDIKKLKVSEDSLVSVTPHKRLLHTSFADKFL